MEFRRVLFRSPRERKSLVADELNSQLLNLTADIVTAHLANNTVAAGDVPTVIQTVHAALAGLGTEKAADQPAPEPAVPWSTSVQPDLIVCLDIGQASAKERVWQYGKVTE